MTNIQTEILIIGGGATGTGLARDSAMRGFKTVLVEKGDLTHGTTGRYHGLLHSGGRYVVKDPAAARECIEENRILRRIMPHCIEDTGGFFVVTPWDDPSYAEKFVAGCQNAGVPVEEISVAEMLRQEPLLNPQISRCFRVPDGSADSFVAADVNAESARQNGAQVLPYHQVLSLLQDGSRVTGARVLNRVSGEELTVSADMVINAAGAWCGQIAASVGIPLVIIPGKGVMLAVNQRILNTVVNRCKMPSDGDIIVPAHTVAVVGTTDVPVKDPDHYAIETWEVNLMLEEGDKLVPGLKDMRMLRAWAGVRPLYQETSSSSNRDVTRAFVLLDHKQRDGVDGLVTITSGKWTTYRKMAEVTLDLVCTKLETERPCRTHLEPLPGAGHGYHTLGQRLHEIEKKQAFGELVCECELATYDDVEQAIVTHNAATIDDVRRDARLGMGPCQGGFCTYRAAGMLHELRQPRVEETNVALRDFLQERWKGLLSILWGQQLRQERLDELIYLTVLGADALPGPESSRLAAVPYNTKTETPAPSHSPPGEQTSPSRPPGLEGKPLYQGIPGLDTLVLGLGYAGLTAGWQAAENGQRVRVVAKGMGATHWSSGCIDVMGYLPGSSTPVASPRQALEQLAALNPQHPYSLLGIAAVEASLDALQRLCEKFGYPLLGSLDQNWMLPTALGTARPTCLAPASMVSGDLSSKDAMLLVGFKQYRDFFPGLIAANLAQAGIPARGLVLDLPVLTRRRFVTGRTLAALFDQAEHVHEVVRHILPHLGDARRVGFPAVLGLTRSPQAVMELERRLGLPVFEIPTLPPSVPGQRLHNLLIQAIKMAGGDVLDGMQAAGMQTENGQITALLTEASVRPLAHRAQRYVLASGGLLGGGLEAAYDGGLHETVFDLPVTAPATRAEWFSSEFLSPEGHAIYRAGLTTGPDLCPLGEDGQPVYSNLQAVGSVLAHFDPIQERSLEGVAVATGYAAGRS